MFNYLPTFIKRYLPSANVVRPIFLPQRTALFRQKSPPTTLIMLMPLSSLLVTNLSCLFCFSSPASAPACARRSERKRQGAGGWLRLFWLRRFVCAAGFRFSCRCDFAVMPLYLVCHVAGLRLSCRCDFAVMQLYLVCHVAGLRLSCRWTSSVMPL